MNHIRLQVPADTLWAKSTTGLDVFSLEITAVEKALINMLKTNMNLINPYLEFCPEVIMSLEIGLVSIKQCFKALRM